MELILDPEFLDGLAFWAASDPRTLIRVFRLIEEIRRDPFRGTGKPFWPHPSDRQRSGDRAYNGDRIAMSLVGHVPSPGAFVDFQNTL